jgi:hypothetical protein
MLAPLRHRAEDARHPEKVVHVKQWRQHGRIGGDWPSLFMAIGLLIAYVAL